MKDYCLIEVKANKILQGEIITKSTVLFQNVISLELLSKYFTGKTLDILLAHFQPTFHFYTLTKYQKTTGSSCFQRVLVEMKHWFKIGSGEKLSRGKFIFCLPILVSLFRYIIGCWKLTLLKTKHA